METTHMTTWHDDDDVSDDDDDDDDADVDDDVGDDDEGYDYNDDDEEEERISAGLNLENTEYLLSSLCCCSNLQDIGVQVYFLKLGVEFSLWISVDIMLTFPDLENSLNPLKLALEVMGRDTFYSQF